MINNSIVEMNPDADVCIVGYDPLPVVFRDMSDTRSFSTRYWEWDFGDSMYFGASSGDGFRLPSDKKLFGYITGWYGSENNDFTAQLDYFHEQVPNCVMSLDYKNNAWATYHKNNYGGDDHFTGLLMRSFSADTDGSGCEFSAVLADRLNSEYDLKRYQFWPNSNDSMSGIIPVGVSGISVQKDECGRDSCETEEDLGNSVMHLYKGPGIYYSTMSCSSETGLQSMELTDKEFSSSPASAKKQHAGCFVRVLPVCPCISAFNVYGTDGAGNWDERSFVTITDENYSCQQQNFSSSTGTDGFNCRVRYRKEDGTVCDTIAVSGYAPYVKVGASGVVVPRSLPVTGAYIDWGDWYTDYMNADHKEFGAVTGGWPLWGTSSVPSKSISGEHVYTMPGVYSIGIAPEFDEDRIRSYMPTVVGYEDCIDSSLYANSSGCCVVVVELPPKFDAENPISHNNISDAYPTVITGMRANVSGGSYPISRIDWDFGDGTEILSISTEAAKIVSGDLVNNGRAPLTVYEMACTTASANASEAVVATSGWFNGNGTSGSDNYYRALASSWKVDHIYNRTMVDDHPDGYVITVSAYAENTNTCTVASAKVLSGTGAALPPYALTEGEGGIELVDIRSGVQSDTNLVLQSAQQDRMYFNKLVEKEQSG